MQLKIVCNFVVLCILALFIYCFRSFTPIGLITASDQQFFRQIMAERVKLTRDLVRNGTHVLMTDVDNIFSRYINLAGFVEEGYDVYHAYEMRFPLGLFRKYGFVVCGGHHGVVGVK